MVRRGYTFYYLQDPTSEEIGYVGMTTESLSVRLRRHIYEAVRREHSENSAKNEWIRHMNDNGIKPVIVELEHTAYKEATHAFEREKFWIARVKEAGHYLTNMTDGGAGTPGLHIEHTEETREKLAKAATKYGDEVLEKGITLRRDGMSWNNIAKELGMSRTNFYKLYKEQIEQALA